MNPNTEIHRCAPPGEPTAAFDPQRPDIPPIYPSEPAGTVWQCECGQMWRSRSATWVPMSKRETRRFKRDPSKNRPSSEPIVMPSDPRSEVKPRFGLVATKGETYGTDAP